ncbi:RagB/SusD family nutrient uptake outer membrane protein [Chitinophaga sp. Cy-1792]|uniref:RagB/SusD family nutrient uptake outer membrane protein n=1 Tax=Chitinophaga sp. Cy-1792 TaxID=2608339 RepID=UPI00142471A3|nr:RagB/SusD family nutrient uptake outer membrane protein [Chitinophaga sp. Cy-1792]NIG56549.1 RagB/SusD family nutrient uptake outer membrane protein [Chitinophaga sp. Cy-1792]
MKPLTKYISYIVLPAMLVFSTACNKKLDVKPGSQISPEQIQTEDDVTAIMLSAYSSLQDASAFGERYIFLSDLFADAGFIEYQGTFLNYSQVNTRQIQKSGSIPSDVWARGYVTINTANIVLANLDKVSDANKATLSAEAKFVRAITYFELAGFYGLPYSAGNTDNNPTVPIVSTAVIDPANLPASKQPRASVTNIYKQIIADLQEAAANLPDEYSEKKNKSRATKYAAYAFLAKVYLAQHNYPEAAKAADAVIESGYYTLASSFDAEFNNSALSSEDIFAILQTSQSNAGTANNGLVTFYGLDQRNDVNISPAQLAQYGPGDQRGKFYSYSSDSSNITTNKWRDLYGTIPVSRLAEMYLTRAEANLRAGTAVGDDPLNDVNLVRSRSKATLLNSVTADDVVQERRLELAFEGDNYWIVKRLQLNVGNLKYNDNMLVFPIPQREMDVNSSLVQNPGY